jgi:DNA mismatch endonuclease (patch repair protein)
VADVFSKAKRSEVMSRIHGRGNRDTELVLATLLRRHGLSGWRRHQAVFGRPDFVFRKQRVAIFVDGCFWHSCRQHANLPTNNRKFWAQKLFANRTRDKRVAAELRRGGWQVVRIWEHELKRPEKVIGKIAAALVCVGKKL